MSKKRIITFTPKHEEMVKEIMDAKGYPTFSSIIHQAVVEFHRKTFPTYAKPHFMREDAQSKVKRKLEEKKAKKEVQRDEYLQLVEALGGTVEEVQGKEFCVYFTYTGRKRYEQKVPLEMVSTDLVKTQYQPSREKVERLQAEGKVDYEFT